MLVIDASIIVRLWVTIPITDKCLNCKTWSVGFLPLFIFFYLIFCSLSRYYAASSRSSFLRATRGELKGTMEERLPSYETARSVNRHCLELTDNAILY